MSETELPTGVREFLSEHFPEQVPEFSGALDERETVRSMVETVSDSLHDNVGELGIALDFLIVAEELSQSTTGVRGSIQTLRRTTFSTSTTPKTRRRSLSATW
ncbi:MAG: hypothetical protein J07HB67_01110 [halophilic archaeon J07HB67]|jgi:hypothetical protein|nr:MAG: hypothetical protein J07HB67_01110 [halophilic archaeon J07HB67]